MKLKLQQGQIWEKEERFYLITRWERLAIRYKEMEDLVTREGDQKDVSKKEFCRLIKGGRLLSAEEIQQLSEPPPEVDGPLEGEPQLWVDPGAGTADRGS